MKIAVLGAGVIGISTAYHLARAGAPLVIVEGADHMIPGRHPVKANLLIRDFVESLGGGR